MCTYVAIREFEYTVEELAEPGCYDANTYDDCRLDRT